MSYRDTIRARVQSESPSVLLPAASKLKVALVFPNTYSVGMTSLGFQWIRQMIANHPDVRCERAFLPEDQQLKQLQATGEEILTYESLSPLSQFDVVAFSMQFELDYFNIINILQLAHIPVRRSDRTEANPFVIAGGACATFNPEPMSEFVDAFVVGDAEPVLPDMLERFLKTLDQPRPSCLDSLADLPGVYLPSRRTQVSRAVYQGDTGASSDIFTEEAMFGKSKLVEIARGCGRRCRFCAAGHIGRPVRWMDLDKAGSDHDRFGLVGAAVFDHCDAVELCTSIYQGGGTFTLSSIRLETLTLETCKLLSEAGVQTVTIAPEAGSDRLRRVLNKEVSQERILRAAANISEAGIRKLRMYFMIGLPTETDQDCQDIIALTALIHSTFPHLKMSVSVSSFVPKPFTPFQWHPMCDPKTLKQRYSSIRTGIKAIGGVDFGGESPRLAYIQALLARGDSNLADMIELAASSEDPASAIRQCNIDLDHYIYTAKTKDQPLPWDFIDMHVSKDYLWQEYQLSLQGIADGSCDMGACRACGACSDPS